MNQWNGAMEDRKWAGILRTAATASGQLGPPLATQQGIVFTYGQEMTHQSDLWTPRRVGGEWFCPVWPHSRSPATLMIPGSGPVQALVNACGVLVEGEVGEPVGGFRRFFDSLDQPILPELVTDPIAMEEMDFGGRPRRVEVAPPTTSPDHPALSYAPYWIEGMPAPHAIPAPGPISALLVVASTIRQCIHSGSIEALVDHQRATNRCMRP